MKKLKYIFLTLITLLSLNSFSQTMPASGTNVGASSGTWTVPTNVYSIKIDAWGGGGAGSGQSTSGTGGFAGGAGGSRSTTTISVTPGQTIYYSVGTARAGVQGNASNGNDTWVNKSTNSAPTVSTNGVVAKGGQSAVGTTAGAGSTTGCIGTSSRGGSGRVGGATSGGGGSSAGTTLAGVDATGTAGATAPAGGGNGGSGHASGGAGSSGVAPGGGGGGAYKNNTTGRAGGDGAAGRVILTYQAVPICATLTSPTNNQTGVSIGPTLTWGVVSGATSYDVYFGSNSSPPFVVNQVGTSYTPSTLNYNTQYYWRVIPKNSAGDATGCSVWTFTTSGPGCLTASNGQYPSTTFTPSCTGSQENITTLGYAGEYSVVSLTGGVQYTFRSSVLTDFITISNSGGTTVLVYGTTPMVYTPSTNETVRFYVHTNNGCGEASVSRTRSVQCTIPPPSNDQCSGAISTSCNTTFNGSTQYATQTGDSPSCYTASFETWTAPGVWYKVIGNGQNVTLSLCTGTSFDTKLFVYTGTCGALTCLTYNDDFCSTQSQVTFATTDLTEYYVMVTGYGSNKGTFQLSVTYTSSPPTITTQPINETTCTSQVTFSVTASGVRQPFTYQWFLNNNPISGANSSTYSTSTLGNYYVSITNTCNQSVNSNTVSLTTATNPSVSLNSYSSQICAGGTGTNNITSTISSGFPTYFYQWQFFNSTWQNSVTTTTINATPTSTRDYRLIVTDSKGCIGTSPVHTVNVIPDPINPTLNTKTPNANNVCVGTNLSATFNLGSDGVGCSDIFQYTTNGTSWQSYTLGSTISTSSIADGITVQIRGRRGSCSSGIGCSNNAYDILASWTVRYPSTLSTTSVNVSCNGGNNGSIDLSPLGNSPFNFNWSNGGTTEDISNLTSGDYSVTVTDLYGCTSTTSVTITQPTLLTSTSTNFNPSCFGSNNGSINLTPSGGTSPYTFLWSNGQTTEDIFSLVANTYSVTVTDSKGCQTTRTVTITQPSLLQSTLTKTNVTCFGNSTGSINLTPSGGTSPYAFSWSSGQTTEDISLLSAGNYSVTITDFNGCQVTNSVTITQPAAALSSSATSVNVACFGTSTGSIDLTVTGGTSPYTYSWSNSATTQDLTNLSSGNYFVTITDANSCQTTRNITITQPSAALSLSSTSVNVSCNGGNTGSIDLSVSGGTLPYSYLWSNSATTQDLTNLTSGTYSVTVTDANSCQSTRTITITQPNVLTSTLTKVDVACFGNSTGSINLTPSGGTSPYTFLWSNNQTTEDLSGIVAGGYSVTVTDANGCQTSTSVTITEPTQLTSSLTQVNVSCNGLSNGSIDLTISGGTSGYTYLWSNGQTTEDISGLTAGNYSVTITDANGCQITNSTTISQPAILTSTSNQFNPSCFGASNGVINLTTSGGTSPYSFLWSNGQTTEDLNSLAAGTYSVTITDSKGCQATRTVTITQPTQLTSTVTTTNVNCYGQNNGSASVTASGGTPPYLYMWNTGNTQSSISNLTAGNYQITVTDNKGCTKITNLTITQPSQISISLTISTYPNCGSNNGVVNSSVIGGTPPFTYSWSNGTTSQNLTGVASGNYTLTVTDSKGCQSQSGMTLGCTSAVINVGQIDGPTSICGLSSGSYTIDYSNASPESITWILPNGITSTNGLGNPTINANFSSSFIQDSVEVDIVSNGITYHRSIWVTKLPNKPIVSGSFCGEPTGSIKSYIVTNSQPNMTYNWVPPYGVNVYSGQGNDTVQFKASIILVSGSGGSVTATNACGSSTKTFTIDRYVVRPPSILGPTTVCADGNTIYTYRVDSVPTSFMYIWNVPNGVSIIGSDSNDTLKVKFSTNFTSGQFSVMSVNKCGSSPMTYGTVSNNNLYANIGTITGPGDLCPYLGQSVTYSVTNQSGTFTWALPTNMTIQSGQGTNSITVLVSNSFSSGTIGVNLNNGCGGSISSSKTLSTTTSTISASSITGPRSVCSLIGTNTPTTFSVTPISGVNYVWSVPANSTIVSGQGTNSINVTFQNGFTGGNIQVVITGGCGNPITRIRTVDLGLPSVSISGVNCVDNGYTNTYSVSTTGALSFNWTVPGNAQIVRGQGTNSIDVFFPSNFESTSCINNSCDSIRLTTQFGCGNVLSKKKVGLLTVRPTVTGTSSVCFPDTIRLVSSTSPRNTSYIWNSPNGVQFIGSTTGNTVMAKTTSSFLGGTFSVMGVNTCGSSPMAYFGVNKVCPNTTKTIGFGELENKDFEFIVFPNPGNGLLQIRIFHNESQKFNLVVSDILGKIYLTKNINSEDEIDLRFLNTGFYQITIYDENKKYLTTLFSKID